MSWAQEKLGTLGILCCRIPRDDFPLFIAPQSFLYICWEFLARNVDSLLMMHKGRATSMFFRYERNFLIVKKPENDLWIEQIMTQVPITLGNHSFRYPIWLHMDQTPGTQVCVDSKAEAKQESKPICQNFFNL